jgi:hypothetical protein
VVSQINRRKPVLKKPLSEPIAEDAMPDSACPSPVWQRSPVRVSFQAVGGEKQTFAIRGQVVDLVNDAEEEEDTKEGLSWVFGIRSQGSPILLLKPRSGLE